MCDYFGSKQLPKRNTNWFIGFVHRHGYWWFLGLGVLLYCGIVLVSSVILYLSDRTGVVLLNPPNSPFLEYVYFNFLNILTLDYGVFSPVGVGKILIIVDALFGVGLLGAAISVVVLKLINPSKNSVVFSKYCYYAQDEEKFFVLFVNTNRAPLVQAEMSTVVKIGGTWPVRGSIMTPYIGKSAWAFFLVKLTKGDISALLLRKGDGLKFGISGSYGFAMFSTAIKYSFGDTIVVPSRRPFEQNPLYEEPDFSDPAFVDAFHCRPEDSQTFVEYAVSLGARQS